MKIFLIRDLLLLFLEHVAKKRGRPPKPKSMVEPKRPQGRPRKSVDSSQPVQPSRPIGRPLRVPRYSFQPQVCYYQMLSVYY